MKTMTIECPDQLASELELFIKEGWSTNAGEAVVEALRRFLQSHRPKIAEEQIRSDIQWGLHGDD